MCKTRTILLSIVLTLVTTQNTSVFAESMEKPSDAAKEACMDKDAGDLCTVVNNEGNSVDGSCSRGINSPEDGTLYCVPNT